MVSLSLSLSLLLLSLTLYLFGLELDGDGARGEVLDAVDHLDNNILYKFLNLKVVRCSLTADCFPHPSEASQVNLWCPSSLAAMRMPLEQDVGSTLLLGGYLPKHLNPQVTLGLSVPVTTSGHIGGSPAPHLFSPKCPMKARFTATTSNAKEETCASSR